MGVCNQWGSPARSGVDTVIWVESGSGMGVGGRALDETTENNKCNNIGCV